MTRRKLPKLYSKVIDISLPETATDFREGGSRGYRIQYQNLPVFAYVCWPSGKPCVAINMYLLDKAWGYTGDTVVTVASKLSELIRYCSSGRVDGAPCGFHDLNDDDVYRLKEKLCNEVHIDVPSQRVRNNNTVRSIMQTSFDFLFWYQQNLQLLGGKIIGSRMEGAAIIVKRRQNSHDNRYYFDHRHLPPSVSTAPKLPISTSMVEVIEETVEKLSRPENYSAPALRRFSIDNGYLNAHLGYLTARRNFMIFMMKTTGLRPQEMARMSVHENDRSIRLKEPIMILPTLKRRELNPPPRNFSVRPSQAMRVRIYLRARAEWVAFCKTRGNDVRDSDAMFLSTEPSNIGARISTNALAKDFETLCNKSGFSDQQSCFSMFRHRFITDLIHIHLMAFQSQRVSLNKQDYRMVLEKVREKTGHKSVNSLWHYIDLVRGMEGVWDPVEAVVNSAQDAEQLRYEIREMRRKGREGAFENLTAAEIADGLEDLLSRFLDSSKKVLPKKI